MNQTRHILYPFMQAVQGNWRNALFLKCDLKTCPYGQASTCEGHLLTASADGTPILMPVKYFRLLTGESVAEDECCGSLTCKAFEAVYALFIKWHTLSSKACPLQQLCPTQQVGEPKLSNCQIDSA